MSKRWSILLIIALLVSCMSLIGCGKSSAPTSSSSEGSKQTEQNASPKVDSELADLMSKAKNVDGIYYETVLKSDQLSSISKMWQQDKKMRSETSVAGMQVIMIVNPDKDLYCTYMPGTNSAMTMDENSKKSMKDSSAGKWSNDAAAAYKVTGSEKKDGYDCKVVEGQPEGLSSPVKMWIREDIGMPVAFETAINGKTMTMEFKNYKLGEIEDNMFELPAGVTVTSMPTKP
ncbi:MAG: LolA family protein [Ignavibacteriales bacterium]